MSTYNGERYLEEQLDSILNQQGVDIYLMVRDDGSTDGTCSILDRYALTNTNVTVAKGNNVGFVSSFANLLESVENLNYQPDFYAFADQDDIWFDNKLYLACSLLKTKDESKPNLFTSNSVLIDSIGNEIGVFHQVEPQYSKGNILIYCTEQGCSMTFNKKALDFFIQKPPKIAFHDRYMYMICYFWGTVSYCHTPLFSYRLHKNNTLGIGGVMAIRNNFLSKLYNLFKYYLSFKPDSNHRIMAKEFFDNYGEMLSDEDSKIVCTYVNYRKGFCNRFKLLNKQYRHPCYHSFKIRTKFIHLLNVLFLKY